MPVTNVTTTTSRRGSPVAFIVDEHGNPYSLHNTPEQAAIGGGGNNYAEIPRQGRKPLVRYDNSKVRTLSFTHTLTEAAGGVLNPIRVLMSVSEIPQRVRLVNVSDALETRGWWYIRDLQVTITSRDERQQPKSAELAWTFIEANDERPAIAKVPPPPPPPPPPAIATTPPSTDQADYVVVKGDSLWRIAYRLLGSGPRWTELFDRNAGPLNLAPAEMYRGLLTVWIYAGMVLKIPAR